MEIKVGAKVKVVKNTVKGGANSGERGLFVGKTAEVVDIKHKSYSFPEHKFMLKFDDYDVERTNRLAGTWLWSTEELELMIEEPKVRIVLGENVKTIYSFPAIIHIISEGGKLFKGVAKCLEDDVYDEARGYEIAKLKATIKMMEYRLKQLVK